MNVLVLSSVALSLRLASLPGDGTLSGDADTFYRINPKSEKTAYYLRVQSDYRDTVTGEQRVLLSEADVYAADKKTVLQRIPFGSQAHQLSDPGAGAEILDTGIDQGDFNFDGYLDFEGWLFEQGGSGGCPSLHFLFDPNTHRYLDSPPLDKLWSTGFDAEERVVRSYTRGGGMYSTAETYRWKGAKLVLVKRVKRDRDDKKGYYTEYSDFSKPGAPKVRRVYLNQ